MSGGGGRGRGYSGRHHLRSPRPGGGAGAGHAAPDTDEEAARTLAELSPRSTGTPNPMKMDMLKDIKNKDADLEKDRRDEIHVKEKYLINADDDKQLQELLAIDEQYAPLLALLEQFSPGEDGIQFNRKLRQFESTIATMCPDEARLHGVFSTFRAAALASSSVARQLAAVGASFTRQQRQQLLRAALLNVVMQGTFSKLDLLERVHPIYLINAANLMGDYFAEARLCNGNKVHILAGPLLQYLRALLASDDIRAHRSLATQLMLNGRELLSVLAQELDDLSISIRLRLLSPPPVSIIWLLLSADLCLNKFLPLPNTLQQFYASHLELSSDENYSEVTYGSWKKEKEDYKSDVSNDLSDKMSHNLSQISLTQDDDPKPKLRPILGAGAGLLRQEQALSVSQDTFETWTPKSSLTKRYDLNSWRQNEEEKQEEVDPVFNPSVLPPNLQNFNTVPTVPTIPDYPPPNRYNNFPENFSNYLQQGDGTYIQSQYQNNTNFTSQGDFVPYQENRQSFDKTQPVAAEKTDFTQTQFQEQTQYQESVQTPYQERPVPERVNNEMQKNASRRPVENWRKEKPELKEDSNRNRPKNWTRQRSKDLEVEEEDKDDKFKNRPVTRSMNRLNRRNSSDNTDNGGVQTKPVPSRRHVTEVPRNQKYWDHDDRCDRDYNS